MNGMNEDLGCSLAAEENVYNYTTTHLNVAVLHIL